MRMAAEPGSGPFDAGTLADRAWLAALPDELAAQRRVMAGLADRCEAWPLVTSLQVGCSLGRGAADALSDIDAALGVNTASGAAGAWQVGAVEAMVVAALPELGALVDVLRHRSGPADQWVRRDGCLVQQDEVWGAAAAAARLDLHLGDDRQVELGAVGELGEDPPDPLVGGPAPVP